MSDAGSANAPVEIPSLSGIHAESFSLGKLLRITRFFGPAAVVASLSLGVDKTIMVTELVKPDLGGHTCRHNSFRSPAGHSAVGINSRPKIDNMRRPMGNQRRIDYLPDDLDQAGRLRKLLLRLKWYIDMGLTRKLLSE